LGVENYKWNWRSPLRYNRRNHRKLLVLRKSDVPIARWASQAIYLELLKNGVKIF